MLETRRRVGVGRLIQDIGDETGVAYVVLQDDEGILAASRQVRHLSAISSDPFLRGAAETGGEASRIHVFEGQEILESVLHLPLEGKLRGLLRVGLWMGPVREVEAWGRDRLLWMSVGLAAAALVLVNFLMLRQNFDALSGAYRQIRTYTGDVLEHMAEGVVVVNTSGKIEIFNKAAEQIFDYSAGEVLGKSCRDIVAEQTPMLEQTLETGKGLVDTECRYTTRRSKDLILSVSTSVIADGHGDPELCIAVVKDLTGEKKFEQELQRRERLAAMGDLAAGVAHEVRNPMNAIGMTVQRLGSEFTPQNDASEYHDLVDLVESEIVRVNGIVDQFLTLARPPKLTRTSVRVDPLVRDLGHLMEAKAAEGQVALSVDAGESKTVTGDREQLSQALLNLLINAIEATPSGGRVGLVCSVQNEMDGDWLTLTVRDTGPGMDEATQRRAFDPYFTTKSNGTGLGLSLVERIISDHSGRVELESSPGAGASFTVLLPMDVSDE
jgi:two-component system sensor histidine kinase HydH